MTLPHRSVETTTDLVLAKVESIEGQDGRHRGSAMLRGRRTPPTLRECDRPPQAFNGQAVCWQIKAMWPSHEWEDRPLAVLSALPMLQRKWGANGPRELRSRREPAHPCA